MKSVYAVKLGRCLYVTDAWTTLADFDEEDLSRNGNEAKGWPLAEVEQAAEVARLIGGRVVRLKTKKRRVIVAERED